MLALVNVTNATVRFVSMDTKRFATDAIKDQELFLERKQKSFGTARVSISALQFDTAYPSQQFRNEKAVKNLVKIFSLESFHRLLDDKHKISALLTADELEQALKRSKLSASDLRTKKIPPKLLFSNEKPLRCLSDEDPHRIAAAQKLLQDGQDWWVVDLYSDNLSSGLQTYLREGFSKPANSCDGEILLYILHYRELDDHINEMKWWARLSRDKRKDLKFILKIPGFTEVFTELSHITGLWPPFQIGPFRRYASLNCYEKLLKYLERVRTVWVAICGNEFVDSQTVELIKLRAPRVSTEDASYICSKFESGEIFSSIKDLSTIEKIKQNVLSIPYLIQTLSSFCEDTKYLEPLAKSMKLLVDLQEKETIDKAFFRIYKSPPPGPFIQQDGEDVFSLVIGDEKNRFQFYLQQLYLKCMRSFPQTVNIACRKDTSEDKPPVTEPNAIVVHELAMLASKFGFSSKKIRELCAENPQMTEIHTCLARLEPNEDGRDVARRESEAEEHLRLWNAQKRRRISNSSTPGNSPRFTDEIKDQQLSHRCGRPFNDAHRKDRRFLFIRWVYGLEEPQGRYITSFFVKCSIITAFLGDKISTRSLTSTSASRKATTQLQRSTPELPRTQEPHSESTTALVLSEYGLGTAEVPSRIADTRSTELAIATNSALDQVIFHLEFMGGGQDVFSVDFTEFAVLEAAETFARHRFQLVHMPNHHYSQMIIPPKDLCNILRQHTKPGARDIWCRYRELENTDKVGKKRRMAHDGRANATKVEINKQFTDAVAEIEKTFLNPIVEMEEG